MRLRGWRESRVLVRLRGWRESRVLERLGGWRESRRRHLFYVCMHIGSSLYYSGAQLFTQKLDEGIVKMIISVNSVDGMILYLSPPCCSNNSIFHPITFW